MNLYELLPTKELKKLKEDKTYITENLINSFHIIMPSTFGDHAINELNFELRVYLPTVNSNGTTEYTEYMGYPLTVENDEADVPITNDITEAVQIVKIMILATKDGNVIGKTNFVDKQIYDAPLKGEPLTPRKDFDEVIEQQRETISEQAETITTQGETITQQGEQITELNGEVTELTTENTRLETQHDADQNTIQYLINNPPEARLQAKSVEPTDQMQIVEPDSGYDGLSNVTVGATPAPKLETLNPITPTTSQQVFNPSGDNVGFPQVVVNAIPHDPIYGTSVAGVYVTEEDEDGYPISLVYRNINNTYAGKIYDNSTGQFIENITFVNCNVYRISNEFCSGFTNLKEFIVPESVTTIGSGAFSNCSTLQKITFSSNLQSVETGVFNSCINLRKILNADGTQKTDYSGISFGSSTFSNCPSLSGEFRNISFSDSASGFYNCTNISYISVKNTTTIGTNFCRCSGDYNLKEVYFGEGTTTINAYVLTTRYGLETLYLPSTISSIASTAFSGTNNVLRLTLGQGWNYSYNVANLTSGVDVDREYILGWFNALADRTGLVAYTLTIGTTNLNKMTAEEKAIATNKNWNLA